MTSDLTTTSFHNDICVVFCLKTSLGSSSRQSYILTKEKMHISSHIIKGRTVPHTCAHACAKIYHIERDQNTNMVANSKLKCCPNLILFHLFIAMGLASSSSNTLCPRYGYTHIITYRHNHTPKETTTTLSKLANILFENNLLM